MTTESQANCEDQRTNFDATCEAYNAARDDLLWMIDHPDKTLPLSEYRAKLKIAYDAVQTAHRDMLAARA
jgi:hypothetical protein